MKKKLVMVSQFWIKYSALMGVLFFVPFYPLKAAEQKPNDICFFEFTGTSPDPSEAFKRKNTGVNVYTRKVDPGEIAVDAFKDMIGKSKQCESLVISSHHTGDMAGVKAKMLLKDMEALSCRDEYKEWFKNIKVLWLDGCNTVTDNKKDKDGDKAVLTVAKKLRKKDPKGDPFDSFDMRAFQQGYAASLDKHTPLSSRYLRMFPSTAIFGFNGSAPANKKREGRSFIYDHMVNLAEALKNEEEEQKTEKAIEKFKRGMNALFEDPCADDRKAAWGQVWGVGPEAAEKKDYEEARKLGCDLIEAKQVLDNPNSSDTEVKKAKRKIISTLTAIKDSKNSNLGHILFNNLYDTWNTAKKFVRTNPGFALKVKGALQDIFRKNPQDPNDESYNNLRARIQDGDTGSLRKGDYLKFYTELYNNGTPDAFVEKQVEALFKERVERITGENQDNKRILAVSVVDQLHQYGLLSEDQRKELSKNKRLFSGSNRFVLQTQTELELSTQTPQEILRSIEGETDKGVKSRKIFAGAKNWLNNPGNPESMKSLSSLATDVFNNRRQNKQAYGAFIGALRVHLYGKTDKEVVDTLFEVSKKANASTELEQMTIMWANRVLEPEQKDALFNRMTSKTHRYQRSDYE